MATDRVNRVHTPAYLQTLSLGFQNREMIADRVAPRVPVAKQSDLYRVWGKRGLMAHESRWSPGTIPNAIEMRWSGSTYYVPLRKLRTPVTDDEKRNADGDIALETSATELVTDAMIVSREKRVADLFTTAANYSAAQKITKAGGSEWDQASVVSTAQPLIDIMALVAKVSANALVSTTQLSVVIPEIVFTTALWNNSAILDRIKYSNTGVVTADLLQAALGVKEVIFSASMSVSGPEVADSDVITGFTPTYLWGDTVWVGLINEGRNQNAPSFARSFNWRAATGNQDRQIRVYRAADEGQESEWHECKEAVGEQIVYADAGGIIINTLSTI
jgi:hypothetical protein